MSEHSLHFNEELHRDYKTRRVIADLRMLDLIDEALAGYDAYREDLDTFRQSEFKQDPLPGEIGGVPARPSAAIIVNHRVLPGVNIISDLL